MIWFKEPVPSLVESLLPTANLSIEVIPPLKVTGRVKEPHVLEAESFARARIVAVVTH